MVVSIGSRNVGGRNFTLKSRKPLPREPKRSNMWGGGVETGTESKFGGKGGEELDYIGFD